MGNSEESGRVHSSRVSFGELKAVGTGGPVSLHWRASSLKLGMAMMDTLNLGKGYRP